MGKYLTLTDRLRAIKKIELKEKMLSSYKKYIFFSYKNILRIYELTNYSYQTNLKTPEQMIGQQDIDNAHNHNYLFGKLISSLIKIFQTSKIFIDKINLRAFDCQCQRKFFFNKTSSIKNLFLFILKLNDNIYFWNIINLHDLC